MWQLLHAGVVAAFRFMAAFIFFALVLMFAAIPERQSFWFTYTPILSWVGLVVALGLALTTDQSTDLTAARLRRGADLTLPLASRNALLAIVIQFGLAAILLAILGLRTPPELILIAGERLGFSSAISTVWVFVTNFGVAFFGANAHAAFKAMQLDSLAKR